MRNPSKRIFAVVLTLLLLLPVFSFAANAVPLAAGGEALRAQWARAKGPEAGGYALEYSYFEPAAAKTQALPLFVFMAGAGEGASAGKELTANSFWRWSSEEYQSRVTNAGGAYLLILRAPEPVCFDTCPTSSMAAAVLDFAATHNVDRARIYVSGWCIGAVGACRLVEDYPDTFAGLVCYSMRNVISEADAGKMKNTAVWLLGSTSDSYSTYGLYTSPSWANVRAALPASQVRLTSCSAAPKAGLLFNHQLWRLGEHDYEADVFGDYENLSTVDGAGNTVENPEFIAWLTSHALPASSSPAEKPSGRSGGFFASIVSFFKRILNFFSRLFG